MDTLMNNDLVKIEKEIVAMKNKVAQSFAMSEKKQYNIYAKAKVIAHEESLFSQCLTKGGKNEN